MKKVIGLIKEIHQESYKNMIRNKNWITLCIIIASFLNISVLLVSKEGNELLESAFGLASFIPVLDTLYIQLLNSAIVIMFISIVWCGLIKSCKEY